MVNALSLKLKRMKYWSGSTSGIGQTPKFYRGLQQNMLRVSSRWKLQAGEAKYIRSCDLLGCIWRSNVPNVGKFLTRKLCSWRSQCCTYRCYCNWLIHLHCDDSSQRPSLCVDIRLLTSRCLYTPRCQARLVHCRGRIVGVQVDQTCFTHKKCLTIMIFRLKCRNLFVMEISSATFGYWRLIACTLHVIKPDWFTAFAVFIADRSTGPVLHNQKVHNVHLKCDNLFVIEIHYRKSCTKESS